MDITPNFKLTGHKDNSLSLVPIARRFHESVVRQAKVGGLNYLSRTYIMEDGSVLRATTSNNELYDSRSGFVEINGIEPIATIQQESLNILEEIVPFEEMVPEELVNKAERVYYSYIYDGFNIGEFVVEDLKISSELALLRVNIVVNGIVDSFTTYLVFANENEEGTNVISPELEDGYANISVNTSYPNLSFNTWYSYSGLYGNDFPPSRYNVYHKDTYQILDKYGAIKNIKIKDVFIDFISTTSRSTDFGTYIPISNPYKDPNTGISPGASLFPVFSGINTELNSFVWPVYVDPNKLASGEIAVAFLTAHQRDPEDQWLAEYNALIQVYQDEVAANLAAFQLAMAVDNSMYTALQNKIYVPWMAAATAWSSPDYMFSGGLGKLRGTSPYIKVVNHTIGDFFTLHRTLSANIINPPNIPFGSVIPDHDLFVKRP